MNLYFVKVKSIGPSLDDFIALAPSLKDAEIAANKATGREVISSSPVKHGHYIAGDTFLHFEHCRN